MPSKEEDVVAAAFQVFLRYGFQRTTMGDIASAAKMSRPALYLVFPSKEEVFKAVISSSSDRVLSEIRQDIGKHSTALKKLVYAFEIWTVSPYELIQANPDAKDLLESGYAFANDVLAQRFSEFESIVGDVLKPLVKSQKEVKMSSLRIANILVGSVRGLKQTAANSTQLRQSIQDLLMITLVSLQSKKAE